MSFRLIILVLLAVFLVTGSVEAQMIYKPGTDYLSLSGKKKKKNTKTTAKEEKKQKRVYTSEIRAGLGFFTGVPISDFNKDVYTGYGVNADGEYFLDPQISVGLNTGYHSYKYDEIHMGQGHFSMIPILARGTYYFKDGNFHPYAGLNAGIFLTRSKYDSIIEPRSYLDPVSQLFVHTPGGVKPVDKKETAFGLVPMAGIVYKPMENLWLNVNLRYNMIFMKERNNSAIGLNLGFAYSFGI